MSKVRVIRVLEYTFCNQETADQHLGIFYVPLNGHREIGPHSDPAIIIRSSGVIDLSGTELVPD